VTQAVENPARSKPDDPSGSIADEAPQSLLAACKVLTKPGITKLVTITALVGLVLGGLHHGVAGWSEWMRLLLGVTLGTAIASGGANALNMWYESDRDALMNRTKTRPIPSNRLSPAFVLLFGLAMCILGSLILWLTSGPMPALVALVTTASYVLAYTPLKPITISNTLVGAIPGALPAMIGTAAVAPGSGFEPLADRIGIALFILMFVWQLPHFFAIAWMCRVDYEAGGFKMLPSVDPQGNHTAAVMITTAALMIPVALLPLIVIPDLTGWATASAAIILGLGLVAMSIRFARSRTDRDARAVFFGSIVHLPVYLAVLVAEALIRFWI
jgi:protoheme IX farnesyltransferase